DWTHDRPSGRAEDRLDQSGNHRLVFDDQHPPARAPDTRLSVARLGPPGGAPDIWVRLGWGTEEGGWHDNAVYNSLHGLLLRIEWYPQIDPQPAVFEFDLRLSAEAVADFALDQSQAEAMARPLARPPAAPPRSLQSNTSLLPLLLSPAQEIPRDPPAADREPYFAEFFPSSWTIMPSESASFGLSETAGPSMTTRSSRPVR